MYIDPGPAVGLLKEKNLRLAAAESCTGGLLSKAVTDISGASEVFECGVVAYANRIKAGLLGVSASSLERFGAVSTAVAEEMARGVRLLASADIGVGITGIAGPLSDNTEKPVGLIYISVTNGENSAVREFRTGFEADVRDNNRSFAVKSALEMIEKFIKENY